jgi:hypothetical protein
MTAEQTVEQYLAAGGRITHVPTVYVVATEHALLPPDEERRRIALIKEPTKRRHNFGWVP